MSLIPISSARGLLSQPATAYNWEILFTDLPSSVLSSAETLSLRARTTSIPNRSEGTFVTQWGPYEFSHAGRRTYGRKLPVRFIEGYARQILPVINRWSRDIFDEESASGLPLDDLKASIWIRLLGPDPEGTQAFTEAVHVYGVLPDSQQDIGVGYDQSGALYVDVIFAYDWHRWELWPF